MIASLLVWSNINKQDANIVLDMMKISLYYIFLMSSEQTSRDIFAENYNYSVAMTLCSYDNANSSGSG